MDRFEITYFYGPPEEFMVKEEIIKDLADAGITLLQLGYGEKINKEILPLAEKYNLRGMVSDGLLWEAYRDKDFTLAKEAVKKAIDAYKETDSVIGFDICDEPGADSFPILSEINSAFRALAPEKEVYINLFPNYASPNQLKSPTYEEHLEAFLSQVKPSVLSYDHYHFTGRSVSEDTIDKGDISEGEKAVRLSALKKSDRSGFFTNIEAVRDAALRHNVSPMLIVLLACHGPYRNLTFGELSWEVNMCLAYGMKRISYFTCWLPEYDDFWRYENAFFERDGKKAPHYFDVKEINSKIKPIGDLLYDKKSLGVFHLGAEEPGTKEFTAFGSIGEISGKDAVIGFFEGGYAYIVNRSYSSDNTLSLRAGSEILRFSGESFINEGKALSLTLTPGEGVLIRI